MGLRQLLFGDAPLKAMVTLGMKYGAGDLIAQQATTPGGELNCARAAVFGAFGTYYGFVNYSVFRLLAWSPVPAAAWPKAVFSAFFDAECASLNAATSLPNAATASFNASFAFFDAEFAFFNAFFPCALPEALSCSVAGSLAAKGKVTV